MYVPISDARNISYSHNLAIGNHYSIFFQFSFHFFFISFFNQIKFHFTFSNFNQSLLTVPKQSDLEDQTWSANFHRNFLDQINIEIEQKFQFQKDWMLNTSGFYKVDSFTSLWTNKKYKTVSSILLVISYVILEWFTV